MWGDWSLWGSCSATCGKGTKTRQRSEKDNAEHGGEECQGEREETTDCNVPGDIPECPGIYV